MTEYVLHLLSKNTIVTNQYETQATINDNAFNSQFQNNRTTYTPYVI
jgi:hypothetical protein